MKNKMQKKNVQEETAQTNNIILKSSLNKETKVTISDYRN